MPPRSLFSGLPTISFSSVVVVMAAWIHGTSWLSAQHNARLLTLRWHHPTIFAGLTVGVAHGGGLLHG